ncbi:dihydropyrimidine dehydrogenase (NAD+) subunit PreA [Acetitomaculum ruminis DSM 5522]|uniref:Dihydroorotate dehydrogenase B (NAD(+)), catalytic subunit n=1 Tax=Acetitomaculum ruminis DSM 5522 TaxID=1120918 RepID=A0A1I0ZLN2_9FIRM|nr:NAD-dependent dihydropyrimidine dehydrogenase subunit PreA [Acetitomaculum ruminis]SFB26594.1 dihydropyrimidine dehydrogenase (NAD+) subunit PreA [Acetitomaculum ruminis DSM 5522]
MTYEKIKIKKEVARCLLCHDAPCTKACKKGLKVADIIRSLRFENITGAVRKTKEENTCLNCNASCMESCRLGDIDEPVYIPQIIKELDNCKRNIPEKKISLEIDFCGVHFENPFILSSSVVGSNYEMVAKAFDMGWAGVAFKTIGLFKPDEVSPRFGALEKEDNPFIGFKNIEQISDHTLEENLGFLRRLKREYPDKIIIASIMGQNEAEWTKLARLMEEAGADMIECNFSCPQMAKEGLGSDVGTNPSLVAKYTAATKKGTKIPVLAKMTPNITKMQEPAIAAIREKADGLAAINTIKSIMNVDLNNFSTAPNVGGKCSVGGYSGKAVKPIALRFINDMKQEKELKNIPISGMGGIETWKDAAEFIAMGCETVQITTAVMQYGYRIIDDLKEGLSDYLAKNNFKSVKEMVGLALENIVAPEDLERDSIEYPRFHKETCVVCGRCYISCFDGGHQAVSLSTKTGKPKMNPNKCVGCQLCVLVCPTGSITPSKKRLLNKIKEEKIS